MARRKPTACDRHRTTVPVSWITHLCPVTQSILTLAVAAVALYVMLHPADPADAQKWAQSAVSLMVGYWLRGRV
jgi:hypothetical protein